MQSSAEVIGGTLEIACDESGYEGEKLIGTTTDVFAHAGVRLDSVAATRCMDELRQRIRSPAQEYKANHLLRAKQRPVLLWLLGPGGPLLGHAHVFLVEKEFYAIAGLLAVLAGSGVHAAGPPRSGPVAALALSLYREGRRSFPADRWQAFLAAANALLRTRDRQDGSAPVESFFRALDALSPVGTPDALGGVLDLLRRSRPRADAYRARLEEGRSHVPASDPLIPAIIRAVRRWGEGTRPVSIVHDRQNTLSAARVARIQDLCRAASAARGGGALAEPLSGLRLVDSRADARVQVADVLAGAARKIASDALNARADAALVTLLLPYVDPCSIWGDAGSWSLLAPLTASRPAG